MKKQKWKMAAALAAIILSFSACTPTEEGSTMTQQPTADPSNAPQERALRQKGTDYTYFWWDYGIGSSLRNAYVQTGNYGLMLDARTGSLKKLGGLEGINRDDASSGTNDAVDALPEIKKASYDISDANGLSDTVYAASYVHNDAYPMSSPSQEGAGKTNAVRIISSGTYMQRFDIMQLLYTQTTDYTARAEFACVSDYLTFTYDAMCSKKISKADVTLSYTLELDEGYRLLGTYCDGKAAVLRREDGQSLAVVLPQGSAGTIAAENGRVTVSSNVTVNRRDWTGFSFVLIPGLELGEQCVLDYYASQSVSITAKNIEPKDTGDASVELNALTSAHEIGMPDSSDYTNYSKEENRTAYERTPFTITNPSDRDVRVTLCFKKPLIFPYANYGLWGMSPMLVDPKTNEPTGISVQYSRNPHNYISYRSVLYGSCWVNCYVYLDVPANGSVSYDFVCAFSCWGETYASSIAQMCLVGWGGNQWWMSASIGSSPHYGETFGFDPERGCGRSLIDDSSPIFVEKTNGAGGADWITIYSKPGSTGYRDVRRQKITVKTVGPNVSQMKVSGYLDNGCVYAELTVTISRSNDYSRMINSFRYEFLKDTTFDRLSLYSLGADNYNGVRFTELAYGDESGQAGTLTVPEQGHKSEYLKQYVDMPGKNVWVSQYGFDESMANSDKGMVIRDYHAELNGKTYDTPTLSFYITNNYCTNLSAELSLPEEIAKTGKVEAGSKVSGTVEYLIVPRAKSEYIGTSPYIKSLDENAFGCGEILRRYAADNAITASASVGEVTSAYPVRVRTASGSTAAEVTITGGIGYVPVTFEGLDSYSGWRLFKVTEVGEEMVDQSVKGNDYWQVYRNPDTDTYDISFNVFQIGETATYRLKKVN